MIKKFVPILLVVVAFIVGTVAGMIYWTFNKSKNVTQSAFESSQSPQTVLTPTPSPLSSASIKTTLNMPKSDAEGEDLTDVPRYPRAIRSFYDKSDDGQVINIEYFAQANLEEIINFYKTNLSGQNWILIAQDQAALNFTKEKIELFIEIIDEDKTNNISQYKIHWIRTQ